MSVARPSSRPPLAVIAERLDAIADELGWDTPPLLIGLSDVPVDGTPHGLVELPPVSDVTDDPVADLLGFTLPDDCSGIAVATQGNGRRLLDTTADGRASIDPDTPAVRYRLIYVLDRAGAAASALRPFDGEVAIDGFGSSHAGPGGRLVDVCHRALGLATPRPPSDTARLWLLSWLDLLLATALGRDKKLTWPVLAGLHPAVSLLEAVEGGLDDLFELEPAALGRMGVALGQAQPWSELRLATARGQWSPHGITAEHAHWMDDGMYARWVLGEFLPVGLYLDELAELLVAPVADGVRIVAGTVADAERSG